MSAVATIAAREEPHDKARRLAAELSATLNDAFDGCFGAEIQPSKRNGGNAIVGFYNIRSYWFAWRRGRRALSYMTRLRKMSPAGLVAHHQRRLDRAAGHISDPLHDLVTAYFSACDELANSPLRGGDEDDDFVDAFCVERVDPLRDQIIASNFVASTKAGAAAALRLAERQANEGDDDLALPLMAAVRGFLEGRAA